MHAFSRGMSKRTIPATNGCICSSHSARSMAPFRSVWTVDEEQRERCCAHPAQCWSPHGARPLSAGSCSVVAAEEDVRRRRRLLRRSLAEAAAALDAVRASASARRCPSHARAVTSQPRVSDALEGLDDAPPRARRRHAAGARPRKHADSRPAAGAEMAGVASAPPAPALGSTRRKRRPPTPSWSRRFRPATAGGGLRPALGAHEPRATAVVARCRAAAAAEPQRPWERRLAGAAAGLRAVGALGCCALLPSVSAMCRSIIPRRVATRSRWCSATFVCSAGSRAVS